MPLRIRYAYASGNHLGYSIERLSDGLLFDFADSRFRATPAQPIAALPEDSGIFAGRYKATLSPTPADQFADGDYTVTVHHTAEGNAVVEEMAATFRGGDDATAFPAVNLPPGAYPVKLGPFEGTLTVPAAASPG